MNNNTWNNADLVKPEVDEVIIVNVKGYFPNNIKMGYFCDIHDGIELDPDDYEGGSVTEEDYNFQRFYVETESKRIYWEDIDFWMKVPELPIK